MSDAPPYVPPKVWKWDAESGGRFANINRPTSGATHEKELPRGEHDLQLYSLATPNGVKVTVLLEELLALGKKEAEYDAYVVNIGEGTQFGSGFVASNPNSKTQLQTRDPFFGEDRLQTILRPDVRASWRRKCRRHFQIGLPDPGSPSSAHFLVTVSMMSSDMRILRPHSRLVSGGILVVASIPILLPRPESGDAKSR